MQKIDEGKRPKSQGKIADITCAWPLWRKGGGPLSEKGQDIMEG